MRRSGLCAPRSAPRSGLTLLEVIVSLAIFLFSLTAIAHLLSLSGDRVLAAYMRSQAVLRCQSKLAEVVAGIEPLSSSSWSSFSENPDWSWQASCDQGDIANLWNVHVSVRRQRSDGSYVEASLSQMVVSPAQRGSTLQVPSSTSSNTGNGSGGSTGGTGP